MKRKYCKNGDIRFNLKKAGERIENLQIFLIFNFEGKRLRYYTGERVDLKKWDDKIQKIKKNYPESTRINARLAKLARFLEEEYSRKKLLDEKITVVLLRNKLLEMDNKARADGFFEFIGKYIESQKGHKTVSTLKKYNNTLNHLKRFSEKEGYILEFETIDKIFEEKFRNYLVNDVGLFNNTVVKLFKTIKVFLNYATETGLNKRIEYQKFNVKETEGEVIFLSWDELMKLWEIELHETRLRKVRDMFCFGCFTGLRFSDIQNLKKANVRKESIEIITVKNRKKNIIPLNQYSFRILEKYPGEPDGYIFPRISNQKANDYLKEIGRFIELNDMVEVVKYKGAERIEIKEPKWKVLTTHVARKTFITNALMKGMQTEVLMDITSHNTHRAFRRYYKIVDEQRKNEMKKVFG